MDISEENPIRCLHCKKEIPDAKTHGEPCPEQKAINGHRLSHGISVDDHYRLEMKERKR